MHQQNQGVLNKYRVLDLSDENGWLCGKILGDLGADVIKIEKPGGDSARRFGPFYHDIPDGEKSLFWFANNTSKRGITLNIESLDGQKIFKRLVQTAHFVIESFPVGYMGNLGLNYSDLKEINPSLIMISISPFGQTGPYKDYKFTDLIGMAMGGLLYISGNPDRAPVRFTAEQCCHQAGAQAAAGAFIAHYHREITGQGQYIDVSIQECILWVVSTGAIINYWDFLKFPVVRAGNRQFRKNIAVRLVFPCKDGGICCRIGVGLTLGPGQVKLVKLMNEEGLGKDLTDINWLDLSFDSLTQEQIEQWEQSMIDFFMRHTKAELYHEAIKRGIMISPLNTPKEIVEYKQLAERKYWIELEHPELETSLTYLGAPFKSNKMQCNPRFRAPLIGEHNVEIYKEELGFSRQELIQLKQNGII